MRQGRIRHGGAQQRRTYGAYATEGSSFCVVPLTHASMSALGACVPMHQTRSLMHASNAQQNKFPPWRMRHTPYVVERPRLMCPHASNESSLRGVWRIRHGASSFQGRHPPSICHISCAKGTHFIVPLTHASIMCPGGVTSCI